MQRRPSALMGPLTVLKVQDCICGKHFFGEHFFRCGASGGSVWVQMEDGGMHLSCMINIQWAHIIFHCDNFTIPHSPPFSQNSIIVRRSKMEANKKQWKSKSLTKQLSGKKTKKNVSRLEISFPDVFAPFLI